MRAVYARFFFRIFESFSGSKHTGDIFRTMEKIGDKESAIAERVRALLAAANSTTAAVVTPSTSSGAPPVPIPRDPRRLDPGADPARVVANLTAAGIQLAVSKTNSMYIHHYFGSEFRNKSGLSRAEIPRPRHY